MNIDYSKSIEPQQRTEIEKYLNPWLFLIPKWCLDFNILDAYAETARPSASAVCDANYQYRRVTITFYSNWFIQPDSQKRVDLVHELIHALTSPLWTYAEYSVNQLAEDQKLKKTMSDELEVRNEQITQDIAYALINKFNAGE